MKPLLVISMLSCTWALAACAHAGASDPADPAARSVRAGETVSMQPGQSVALPDRSRLRFVAVSSDSRCKPKVQCIWAGEAVLDFQWTGADGAQTAVSINSTDDQRKNAGPWAIELQSLDFADPPNAKLVIAK